MIVDDRTIPDMDLEIRWHYHPEDDFSDSIHVIEITRIGMREVIAAPVISDGKEAMEIFRHPLCYIPLTNRDPGDETNA